MPLLRQDLATRRWTIIATERAKRPDDFIKQAGEPREAPAHVPTCPFCVGNEHMTPQPVYLVPDPASKDGKGWSVRVVPNKFPALVVPQHDSEARKRRHVGRYLEMDGCGQHEVVIESPDHSRTIATMSLEQVVRVVCTYRARFLELDRFDWNQLIIIFRNQGEVAGTSLLHPHSQIVGTPIVPQDIRCRLDEAQRYFDDNGTCVLCDVLDAELSEGTRVVASNAGFVAFCPFAAAVPYEIWIVPRRHASSFGVLTEEEADLLARILRDTLRRLYLLLSNPDYNYVIRSSPHQSAGEPHFHWYLEIQPRLATRAGFEIGSGMNVNVVAPEAAAAQLRGVSREGAVS
ncbi:MAG: galactose-1-phosphate uridylyltransferase [Candidatus Eisenbacteria bacterium]